MARPDGPSNPDQGMAPDMDDLELPSDIHHEPGAPLTSHPSPVLDEHEADDPELGRKVANGAKWSMIGNIITRAGAFITGAVVVNLIDEHQLGVYAIAMTVGQMLLTFIDMGLGADLNRGSEQDMERKAPSTATLGLGLATIGALVLLFGGHQIARALNSPDAGPLMQVYAAMVFIGGLAIVPQAVLSRRLDQRSFILATIVNFIVSNGLTFYLLLTTDMGVLSLPIGAVVGMALEVALFFVFAKRGPKFGWDRQVIGPALSFGAPVAGSNMLQVLLANLDRIVVSKVLGERPLGHYTLASNVANWPVSVFGLVVRSVALPAFAQTRPRPRDPVLTLGAQLTWLIALPVGIMLALFSRDVVLFVYKPEFLPAVPLLTTLGIYGAIRVMFDTFTGYLYARGDSRSVLVANIAWALALVVVTTVAARTWHLEGAALAQVATVVLVALPIFAWAINRAGASITDIVKAMAPATLAVIPAAVVSLLLSRLVDSMHLFSHGVDPANIGALTSAVRADIRLDSMIGLAVGGFSFLGVYIPLVYRRVRASLSGMRAPVEQPEDESATA